MAQTSWSRIRSGYLVIQDDCHLEGTIDMNVTVVAPAVVYIDGTLTKHLTVMPGATVILNGIAQQSITNRGGTLYVYGTIQGTLELKGGKTDIDHRSYVSCIAPIPKIVTRRPQLNEVCIL